MPYFKRITPWTYALTGFGGHGQNTAPAAAKVLAEHFLGSSNRLLLFGKIPLSWNGSKFGPLAAEAVFNIIIAKDFFQRRFLGLKRI